MKTLGLAFAIVAAAGSVVYFLIGFVFHAQEYAGGIASLIFGALPLLHQELEKQATKSTPSAITSQTAPGPTSPFTTPTTAQAAPSDWQILSNPTTATAPPTPAPPRSAATTYITNPTPPNVSGIPAPGPTAAAVTPSVATPVTTPLAPIGASSRTRPMNPVVIFVYSIAVVIAVRGASDFTRLLFRWYEGLPGDGVEAVFVFIGSWLPLLIVGVGVFLVGMWVGRKSPRSGWLITLGAVVLGLLFARLINIVIGYDESNAFVNDYLLPRDQASVDWRFANPDDYDRLVLTLSWAFIFGMIALESIVALVGYWIGKRWYSTKISRETSTL